MGTARRDSEKTKARILRAARQLFAERDIASVGIRDIAAAAGVSHGLVQRYCGTREQMIAAIVRQEIELFSMVMPPAPAGTSPDVFGILRELLKVSLHRLQDFAPVIARAELAGIEPGTMIEQGRPTPAMRLTEAIRRLQATAHGDHPPLDPVLVSAYVTAAHFAFGAMAPWLMASVGLKPEDYEARLDEITDISVRLIALAVGDGPETS
jgi:AcrR family transcriptional regulator